MKTVSDRALRAVALFTLWGTVKAFAVWFNVFRLNEYSDTYYFFLQCEKAAQHAGLATMSPEYPTPAAAVLMLPWWAGMQGYDSYRLGFLALVIAIDVLFVGVLIFRTHAIAVVAWIVLETFSGGLVLLRLDVLPAVLAAVAILLLIQHRTAVGAAFLALGAAAKLWPVVLFPLFIGEVKSRVKTVVTFAVTGLVVVVASVASAGWPRLFTPLNYQKERGLQIESVAATGPMLARLTDQQFQVYYSKFVSFEVSGPTVEKLLRAADVAAIVGVLGVIALFVVWWRSGHHPEAAGYLALTEIGVFMATSKALSPQYFLWLAAPTAVLLGGAWAGRDRSARLRASVTAAAMALLTGLTSLVYPVMYDNILMAQAVPTYVLAARNVLLVCFVVGTAAATLLACPVKETD